GGLDCRPTAPASRRCRGGAARAMTVVGQPVVGARAEPPRIALIVEIERARAAGTSPNLEQWSPYQWAAACHDLWEAGRIELLEHAVRLLSPEYPDIEYLQSLVALFDGLPRHEPPPLDFCDDPAAEVQVVRRAGCDRVLIAFCAREGTLGLPV